MIQLNGVYSQESRAPTVFLQQHQQEKIHLTQV